MRRRLKFTLPSYLPKLSYQSFKHFDFLLQHAFEVERVGVIKLVNHVLLLFFENLVQQFAFFFRDFQVHTFLPLRLMGKTLRALLSNNQSSVSNMGERKLLSLPTIPR